VRTLFRSLALTACVSAAVGCGWFEPEVHVIPHGYVGPVVILFSQPAAEEPEPRVYRIPVDGVLCFKGSYRRSNEGRRRFFYEAEGGERNALDYGASLSDETHVYGFGDGIGGFIGEGPDKIRRYFSYMVGSAEPPNWKEIRDEAALQAEARAKDCPLPSE